MLSRRKDPRRPFRYRPVTYRENESGLRDGEALREFFRRRRTPAGRSHTLLLLAGFLVLVLLLFYYFFPDVFWGMLREKWFTLDSLDLVP